MMRVFLLMPDRVYTPQPLMRDRRRMIAGRGR
jgi:hypothetical protein